jgi:membrane protein required for colicin V production
VPHLASDFLSNFEKSLPLIAFMLVFIIILIIIKSIGELIDRLTKLLALGLISKILGAIFGMIKLLIVCGFLILLAADYDILDKETTENSILLNPVQKISTTILPQISKHKQIIIEATKESTEKAKQRLEQKINAE